MAQQKEKKYFLSEDSQLNADDAPFIVSPNSWVNAENIRTGSTDKGITGTVESIGGTLLLSIPQPSATFITIGSATDLEQNRILNLKFNTTGTNHCITCFDEVLQEELVVIRASQIVGGLNFSKSKLIHSARVVNGDLIFTDDLNNIKSINIDAGLKLNNPSFQTSVEPYVEPIESTTVTLIKRPPVYRLNPVKIVDTDFFNNNTYNQAYQFCYQYQYKNYQYSVLSTYSQLIPFNIKSETYNGIDVIMQFSEHIDEYVQCVVFCVKLGNEGKTIEIKRWDKGNDTDLSEINNHNAGLVQLTYRFYDNQANISVDDTTANTSFDLVPLSSKTLEVSDNRLFLGNNLVGYDTPLTTSMIAAPLESAADSVIGFWRVLHFTNSLFGDATYYLLDINNIAVPGFYYFGSVSSMPPPDTIDFTTGVFVNADPYLIDLAAYFAPTGVNTAITFLRNGYSTIVENVATLSLDGALYLKSGASYNVSVAFYDQYRRKCGVVQRPYVVNIPERTYAAISNYNLIQWYLDNNDAQSQIPDWAYYYQVQITKNLTTRFFVQARAANATYVIRNQDKTYTYGNTSFSDSETYAIGIDISALPNFGMGYVYSEGDLVKLIFSGGDFYKLRILGNDGNYILVHPIDVGTLDATTDILFEIYTPYRSSDVEPYFETGDMMYINAPTTSARTFSTMTGYIIGSIYILERNDTVSAPYNTENMSPLDEKWQDWQTDTGWVNFFDNIGQVRKKTEIRYSDTIVFGTKTNALNKFQPLATRDIDKNGGQIQKLQLTSKVQNELGVVMLCVCENQTASIYIGETQQYGSNTATNLTISTNVIGTVNFLKGDFGTINPESVTEYRGSVFFYSANTGKYIQYSSNGLFPISSYKMTRFWNQFSLLYNSLTEEEIENLGGRPFIFSTVDPNHNELLISIPRLLTDPPKGYLPDYPDKMYPFDIYDGQGKTIVYKLDTGTGRPKWMGSFSFNPEYFITLQNKLYSFRYGHLYLHNQSNYNEFYGIQYSSKIMIVSNALLNNPKVYESVGVESNLVPSFVYMYNDYPYQQASDLVDLDFTDLEGIFYCTIKRNKLIPTVDGYTTDGLLTGEKMRNTAMFMLFEWRISTIPLELKFLNIGFQAGKGQPV